MLLAQERSTDMEVNKELNSKGSMTPILLSTQRSLSSTAKVREGSSFSSESDSKSEGCFPLFWSSEVICSLDS